MPDGNSSGGDVQSKLEELLKKNQELIKRAESLKSNDENYFSTKFNLAEENGDICFEIAGLRADKPARVRDYKNGLMNYVSALEWLDEANFNAYVRVRLEKKILVKKSKIERAIEELEEEMGLDSKGVKISRRDVVMRQLNRLKNERCVIPKSEGREYRERMGKIIDLSNEIAGRYTALAELSENEDAVVDNYGGAANNFAEAGMLAENVGEDREASRFYLNAARAYKSIMDLNNTSLYARKARFARRTAITKEGER